MRDMTATWPGVPGRPPGQRAKAFGTLLTPVQTG
jgi:hypothetical protein